MTIKKKRKKKTSEKGIKTVKGIFRRQAEWTLHCNNNKMVITGNKGRINDPIVVNNIRVSSQLLPGIFSDFSARSCDWQNAWHLGINFQ